MKIIVRMIQIIRKSTYIFEANRHYPRIAIRTIFSWYPDILIKITKMTNTTNVYLNGHSIILIL